MQLSKETSLFKTNSIKESIDDVDEKVDGAVGRTTTIYYRRNPNASGGNTPPEQPTASTTIVNTDTDNVWTYRYPAPKKGCIFYIAQEYLHIDASVSYSTYIEMTEATYTSKWVHSSDNTYIDGGSIYAHSITSEQIQANTIAVGDLNGGKEVLKQANTYTLIQHSSIGNIAGWHRLGTLTSSGDSSIFRIHVESGNGFNANTNQNSSFDITIKDGYQQTPSATNAFGVTVNRVNATTVSAKVFATNDTTCTVWVYFPWSYPNGYYSVFGIYNNWVNDQTVQTASPSGPGTVQNIDFTNRSDSYITYIDAANGIRIHNADDTTNYARVNADGLEVIKSAASVAKFGTEARIGELNKRHAGIRDGGFYVYSGTESNSTMVSSLGYDNAKNEQGSINSKYPFFTFGQRSVASGRNVIGALSVSEGNDNQASGHASHVEGSGSDATGNWSHAEGHDVKANGNASHAGGWKSQAVRDGSFAHGLGTKTHDDYQTAIGVYNADEAGAFLVGNGTESSRETIFKVDWNGDVASKGTIKDSTGVTMNTHNAIHIYTYNVNGISISANSYVVGRTLSIARSGSYGRCIVGWYAYNNSSSEYGASSIIPYQLYVNQSNQEIVYSLRNVSSSNAVVSMQFFVLFTDTSA